MNHQIDKKITIELELSASDQIEVGENQHLTYVFFTDDKNNVDCTLEFMLTGMNSEVKILGFNLGNKGASSTTVRVVHKNKNTIGNTWIKTILGGNAKSNINGMIKIENDSAQTSGYFTHNSLLISKDARVTSVPSLEIETNQVKASHASTTGHLDNEILFYLNSRGIESLEAKKLVIASFTHEYVGKIDDENSREKVIEHLDAKIAKLL